MFSSLFYTLIIIGYISQRVNPLVRKCGVFRHFAPLLALLCDSALFLDSFVRKMFKFIGSEKIHGLLILWAAPEPTKKKTRITLRTCPFFSKTNQDSKGIQCIQILGMKGNDGMRKFFSSPAVVHSWVEFLYLPRGKINV